eukprot:TRINITY_DN15203_c0_g1_i1.p1 TRINITY_DN15203_c0_g1~~TRINITY_DN15203_c0_g1_i1.p1  ORF type:complete len:490 (+),score=107.77 TRINITY_DN15203_c0_g1_i1:93-1562(+)
MAAAALVDVQKIQTNLLINNQWVPAVSGKTFPSINPSTGQVIVNVAEGDAADVDKAVAAARAAFAGEWGRTSAANRGLLLFKVADLIEKNLESLSALETLDNGKPLSEARSDVQSTANTFRYYGGWADKVYGQTFPSDGETFAYTRHEPIGVCGQIIPWNFPLLMASWKIAPALATGNTVVLKLAEQTPLSGLRLGELLVEAGLPAGVVNILNGFGKSCGAALCRHPDVDKVAFTGSVETGRLIRRMCTEANLKRCTLELGGKSPNIVFGDVRPEQMDEVVKSSNDAIFANQGQVCCAGSRLFVHESVYDEFVKRSAALANKRTVGNPFEESSEQGPQVDRLQFDKVMSYIAAGREGGATLACGGQRVGDAGFFVQPTIFSDVRDDMKIAQEEIFGPVLCVLKFKDIDEVLARANASSFGLAAAVWTNDIKIAQRMTAGLKAGTVWVNCYGKVPGYAPFGGFKNSGLGRELGSYGLLNYTEVKTVYSQL